MQDVHRSHPLPGKDSIHRTRANLAPIICKIYTTSKSGPLALESSPLKRFLDAGNISGVLT